MQSDLIRAQRLEDMRSYGWPRGSWPLPCPSATHTMSHRGYRCPVQPRLLLSLLVIAAMFYIKARAARPGAMPPQHPARKGSKGERWPQHQRDEPCTYITSIMWFVKQVPVPFTQAVLLQPLAEKELLDVWFKATGLMIRF